MKLPRDLLPRLMALLRNSQKIDLNPPNNFIWQLLEYLFNFNDQVTTSNESKSVDKRKVNYGEKRGALCSSLFYGNDLTS